MRKQQIVQILKWCAILIIGIVYLKVLYNMIWGLPKYKALQCAIERVERLEKLYPFVGKFELVGYSHFSNEWHFDFRAKDCVTGIHVGALGSTDNTGMSYGCLSPQEKQAAIENFTPSHLNELLDRLRMDPNSDKSWIEKIENRIKQLNKQSKGHDIGNEPQSINMDNRIK